MYLRDANIAIVGYGVTRRETMEYCEQWIDAVRHNLGDECIIVAVGNKIDLLDLEARRAHREEAIAFFEKIGIASDHYFQTSAKTGEGVTELFTSALRFLMNSVETTEKAEPVSPIPAPQTPDLLEEVCIIS